jgi:hypothetical protein
MSTNTGRHDYRAHAHDTPGNPLNGEPYKMQDHDLPAIAPETRLGTEGGMADQKGKPKPGTNLKLNKTVDTNADFVHVAPETLKGQEHVNGSVADD